MIDKYKEIARLILMFTYSATDVYIHSYADDETLKVETYISFTTKDDVVKHMYLGVINESIKDAETIPSSFISERDGAIIFTPKEIVLFPSKKVRDVVDGAEHIPIGDVLHLFTILKYVKDEE